MRAWCLALLFFAGSAEAELRLVRAEPLTVACDDLDLPSLQAAIEQELAALERSLAPLRFGATSVRASDYAARTLRPLLAHLQRDDRAHLCGALQYNYAWLHVGDGPIVFTAYHTPTVRGALTPDATYRFPLYRRPKDASARFTTAQILGGALEGRGLELCWLADPYDALALHVEGAGSIALPDGTRLAVGADGHNGHPYQNVSKLLSAAGKLPAGPPPASSGPGNPKARAYFAAHPADLDVYWGKNPHFVFFRRGGGGGRFGPLVAGRALAVDPEHVPLGALLYVRTRAVPARDGATAFPPMTRAMLAQDVGAGIRGQRMDIFFGDDDKALVAAQALTVQGDAWVLVAK